MAKAAKPTPKVKRANKANSPAPPDSSPPDRRPPPNWGPIEAAYLRYNKPPRALAEMPEAREAGLDPLRIARHLSKRGLARKRAKNGEKIRARWLAESESRALQFERAHAGKFALAIDQMTAAALDALNPSKELAPELMIEMYKAVPAMVQAAARAATVLMDIRGIPKPKQSLGVDVSGKVGLDVPAVAENLPPEARAALVAAVAAAIRPKP